MLGNMKRRFGNNNTLKDYVFNAAQNWVSGSNKKD